MFAPLQVFAGLNDAPSTSAVLVKVKATLPASASDPASSMPPDEEVDPDEDDDEDDVDDPPPLLEPPLEDDGLGVDSDEHATTTRNGIAMLSPRTIFFMAP